MYQLPSRYLIYTANQPALAVYAVAASAFFYCDEVLFLPFVDKAHVCNAALISEVNPEDVAGFGIYSPSAYG